MVLTMKRTNAAYNLKWEKDIVLIVLKKKGNTHHISQYLRYSITPAKKMQETVLS